MNKFPQTPTAAQQSSCATPKSGNATPPSTTAASPTQIRGQNLQPIFEEEEEEEVEDLESNQEAIEHPRLKQIIQRDHPVDNILGSLRKGVLTRSHLANFVNITLLFLLWNQLRLKRLLKMRIG